MLARFCEEVYKIRITTTYFCQFVCVYHVYSSATRAQEQKAERIGITHESIPELAARVASSPEIISNLYSFVSELHPHDLIMDQVAHLTITWTKMHMLQTIL